MNERAILLREAASTKNRYLLDLLVTACQSARFGATLQAVLFALD